MCPKERFFSSQKEVLDFTLPKLHKGKQWYVDFYAKDPMTGTLRRKKYMLDRYGKSGQRSDMAAVLIHNIYKRLMEGWNPWVVTEKAVSYFGFSDVVSQYKEYLPVAAEKKIIKPHTAVDYKYRLRSFEQYVAKKGNELTYTKELDRKYIVGFLDYLIMERGQTARSRNNMKIWLSSFCSWMKERGFIDSNPVEGISTLKQAVKKRDALSDDDLRRLREYTKEHCPQFYLACLMEYYTFIRPNELRFIKVGDVKIKEQTVLVSSEYSKNRKSQSVAVNETILREMIDQKVFDSPSDFYLFGKDITPSAEQASLGRFATEWSKVRKALNFPDSYQFYSLKDTGIRDLANAEGIVVARDQARHSDISITNNYLKEQNIAHQETKHFKGGL